MAWNEKFIEICPGLLEYSHTLRGELLYGTKEQLIALGLGMGIEFPISERKQVRCNDPRGFPARISLSTYLGEGIYCAAVDLPGRERPQDEWIWFDQGIELQKNIYWDDYKGEENSLVAAGLVPPQFFPGKPGMGKVQVTLDANGDRRTDTNGWKKREAGAKTIKKISRTLFLVSVRVSEEIADERRTQYRRSEDDWEQRMRALPRPQSLTKLSPDQINSFRMVFAKRDKKFQKMIISLTQSTFEQ